MTTPGPGRPRRAARRIVAASRREARRRAPPRARARCHSAGPRRTPAATRPASANLPRDGIAQARASARARKARPVAKSASLVAWWYRAPDVEREHEERPRRRSPPQTRAAARRRSRRRRSRRTPSPMTSSRRYGPPSSIAPPRISRGHGGRASICWGKSGSEPDRVRGTYRGSRRRHGGAGRTSATRPPGGRSCRAADDADHEHDRHPAARKGVGRRPRAPQPRMSASRTLDATCASIAAAHDVAMPGPAGRGIGPRSHGRSVAAVTGRRHAERGGP